MSARLLNKRILLIVGGGIAAYKTPELTGEDGSFELPNLPAGENLELQVWHESGQMLASPSLVAHSPARAQAAHESDLSLQRAAKPVRSTHDRTMRRAAP